MPATQHFAMGCIDRISQERFYAKHFGFRRARVFNAGTPNEFVMARLGGMCIEFFGGAPAEARGGEQSVGFRHLAFEVEDMEAKIAELQADGVKTGEIIDCSGVTPGMRVCFFNDPEGNVLEIMQGWRDEENPPSL
ncbi:MAG TPA: VOC family protein [Tepidisphaeraceae bacterium]|nr:VOC family protein [Tepidisphaeraceae bacterium]